ncbi:MAG: hypothetical protein H6730_21880 [Deltaproteobacteria bacterium]|nr:hypothetical protein [Deltaproteobacteria bacterium]
MSALAVALGACRGAQEAQITLPEDLAWVAVLSDGAGSAVTPWPPGTPLPVVTRGAGPHLVLGYTAAQLAAFGTAVEDGTVRAAVGCDPTLPTPRWVGTLQDGVLTESTTSPPALTVPGLAELCPAEVTSVALDVRGPASRCGTDVTRKGACGLEIGTDCGLGTFTGQVQPDGRVCLQAEAGACGGGLVWSDAPLACTGRVTEVGVAALVEAAPPPFELAAAQVADGAPFFPPTPTNQLNAGLLRIGRAWDLFWAGPYVGVTVNSEGPGGECFQPPNHPTALVLLDPDTLTEVQSSTVPPCTQDLVPHPSGDGWVGTFYDRARGGYVWIGADGRVRRQVVSPMGNSAVLPRVSVVAPAQDRLLTFWSGYQAEAGGVRVVAHRLSDLAWVATTTIGTWSQVRSAALVEDGRLLIAADTERYGLFSVSALAVEREFTPPDPGTYVLWTLSAFVEPDRPSVGLAINGSAGGLILLHEQVTTSEQGILRLPLDPAFNPSVITPWGVGGDLLLVAGVMDPIAGEPRRGAVSLFERGSRRFLPGTWPVGEGMLAKALRDDAGRVFLLESWTGRVLRLTPR